MFDQIIETIKTLAPVGSLVAASLLTRRARRRARTGRSETKDRIVDPHISFNVKRINAVSNFTS